MATLITVLLVSLFGSLHCAGMCGPLVAFAMGTTEQLSTSTRIGLQIAYHGGRLASYAIVGAACGLLGAAIDLGGSLVGLNRAAAIMAGVMMIAVGLIALAHYGGVRLPKLPLPRGLQWILATGQRAAMGLQPVPRALAIGLLTALLPCGWLYAFAVVAAGTGSALMGSAVMIAFWLGTVPVLASLGIGVQTLAGTLGRRIPLITALIIVTLGLYTVVARPAISIGSMAPAIELQGSTRQQVESLQDATPPCCQKHGQSSEE